MKKLLIGTGLLLLVGAGCASSSKIAAEQAAAPAPAPTAPAREPVGASQDGTYCWDKSTTICHNILFGSGTVELVVGNRATGDIYKLTKQPSGKYSFTATEINSVTFLTIKDINTLEAVTLNSGTSGSTTSEPQKWVRK